MTDANKALYGELKQNGEYTPPTETTAVFQAGLLIVYAEANFTPTLNAARAEIQVRYYPQDCTYRYQPSNINGVGQDLQLQLWQQDGCGQETFRPSVQLLISNTQETPENQCYIVYHPSAGQMLQLWDDSGQNPARPSSTWIPQKANINASNYIVTEGRGMATNSQCMVDYQYAWERLSTTYNLLQGNNTFVKFMEWNTPIKFYRTFAGPKILRVREAVAASAWVQLGPWTVPDGPTAAPSGGIDQPADNSSHTLNSNVTFNGWALDNVGKAESTITKVKVFSDGVFLDNATIGVSPVTNVCGSYVNWPGCPNVGWTYTVNTNILGAGTHLMEFVVYDNDTPAKQVRVLRRNIVVN